MPAQLQAHSGDVRCGRCMQVFDGFEALAVDPRRAGGDAVRPEVDNRADVAADVYTAPRPDDGLAGNVAEGSMHEGAVAPIETAPEPAASVGEPDGVALQSRSAPGRGLVFTGIAASVFLALVLAAQIAYALRSELAARHPVMKTVIGGACSFAGCSVPLPQRPDLVKIEASDVRMIDASRPALIQLTATLRSYARHDLAYPALDLVLTNANEHALARRIFVPEDYLDATRDIKAGMPPNAEITVTLDLDTGDLNASGFRIDLLAAPPP